VSAEPQRIPRHTSASSRRIGDAGERLHAVAPRRAALAILGVDRLAPAAAEPSAADGDARSGLPRADGMIGFQADAVDRATAVLARRGGVLIADAVGMGKTRVGAALALAAVRAGKRVLLVVPAGLIRQWRTELRRQGGGTGARCEIVSHTSLSRNADPEAGGPPFGMIVVDEAHGFRNPRTRRYAALSTLARQAEVVLLSATPVNNSLLDLYFLIRLFAGDGAFCDVGVPDLGRLLRLASLSPDAPPPPALAAVLATVLIRRASSAAVGLAERGLRFPARAAPAVVRYDLTDLYRDGFDDAVAAIEALRLPPYRLSSYAVAGTLGAQAPASRVAGGAGIRAVGAAELLRLLLAKRLESGVAAFEASVAQLVEQLSAFAAALDRGLLRRPSDRPRGPGAAGDQLAFEELLLARLPPGLDVGRLRADTAADLALLRALDRPASGGRPRRHVRDGSSSGGPVLAISPAQDADADPKVEALRRLLFGALATEKVLVFTEFRDTALHLWRSLRDLGGVALIHGGRAYLGAAPAGRGEVVRRFAPRSNGVREPPAREAVRVLIATDVLSEGLNLQDAAHVVSFDLPWNPVRLIQRIGRVDRLGSLHAVVYAHHFLPDAGLERLLGLVERLRRKLAAIRAGLGADGAEPPESVLGPDTRGLVERLAAGDPTLLDALEAADAAAFGATGDALSGLRKEAARAASARLDDVSPASTDVLVAAVRGEGDPHAVVALRGADGLAILEIDADGIVAPPSGRAVAALRLALSDDRDSEPSAADLNRARAVLRLAGSGRLRPPPRPAARSAAALAIRRLRSAAAALPDGPAAGLCDRIDRLTIRLARGLPAGQEGVLAASIERWTSCPADVLCERLERLLGGGSSDEALAPTAVNEESVVAVLVCSAAGALSRPDGAGRG
jgi:hypothetical protein